MTNQEATKLTVTLTGMVLFLVLVLAPTSLGSHIQSLTATKDHIETLAKQHIETLAKDHIETFATQHI